MRVLDRPTAGGPPVPPVPSADGRRRFRIPGLVPLAIVLTVLGGLAIAVQSPVRLVLDQRNDIADGRSEIETLEAEIVELERQARDLQDPDAVELMAREEFLLSRPGDDVFVVRPPPVQALDFPVTWPFAGFERLIGSR